MGGLLGDQLTGLIGDQVLVPPNGLLGDQTTGLLGDQNYQPLAPMEPQNIFVNSRISESTMYVEGKIFNSNNIMVF